MLTHCNNFDRCIKESICLDLDKIFDQNEKYLYARYSYDRNIKHITLFRSKNNLLHVGNTKVSIKMYKGTNFFIDNVIVSYIKKYETGRIGDSFLTNCENLTTIDLSPFSNVTSIDNNFLDNCKKLTAAKLSSLSNVTSIGDDLLCSTAIRTIDLSTLSNVTSIDYVFLY